MSRSSSKLPPSQLDRFVHPRVREVGGDLLRRARLAVGVLLFFVVSLPVSLSALLYEGKYVEGVSSAALWLASVGLIAASRLGVGVKRLGYLLGGVVLPSAAINAWSGAGLGSASVLGMMLLPSLTVFLSGARAGWVFVGAVIGSFVGVSYASTGSLTGDLERLVGLSVLALVVTGTSIAAETQRRRSDEERVRALEEAEAARDRAEVLGRETAAAREAAEAARLRAERASQAKSEFLANMSHDKYKRETA